jgi:hypothetical protein
MPWEDQQPPSVDQVCTLHYSGPASIAGWFEIDKIDERTYRLSWGNLFACEEIARSPDLEPMLRAAHKAAHAPNRHQMQLALAPLRVPQPA